jgi:hypothetical protein
VIWSMGFTASPKIILWKGARLGRNADLDTPSG